MLLFLWLSRGKLGFAASDQQGERLTVRDWRCLAVGEAGIVVGRKLLREPQREEPVEQNDLVRAMHEAAVVGGTLVQQLPDPPAGSPFEAEWKTFKREIYRLMCAGNQGRFALVKGDQVVSVWDTMKDAIQAGRERFGSEPIFVQEVQLYVKPLKSGYSRLCQSS